MTQQLLAKVHQNHAAQRFPPATRRPPSPLLHCHLLTAWQLRHCCLTAAQEHLWFQSPACCCLQLQPYPAAAEGLCQKNWLAMSACFWQTLAALAIVKQEQNQERQWVEGQGCLQLPWLLQLPLLPAGSIFKILKLTRTSNCAKFASTKAFCNMACMKQDCCSLPGLLDGSFCLLDQSASYAKQVCERHKTCIMGCMRGEACTQ